MSERRAGLVIPLVPRLDSEAMRPGGEPLPELWRRWWVTHGVTRWANPNSAKNARRCEELSRSLPPHPAPGDIVVWLAALAAGGLAPGTVAQHRDILHGVYSHALAAGWTSANPVALAPWTRPPPPEPHPIRDIVTVWPRLLSAARDARERGFLGCLRFTGARLEEALALQAVDVMRAAEPWRLSIVRQRVKPNGMATRPPKGRKGRGRRAVPIRPELRALLSPLLALPPVQLRFGTRGMPRTVAAVPFLFPYRQNNLNELRARLAAVSPEDFAHGRAWHTFRRTLACEMYAAGKSVEAIAEVLGHESVKTTEGYIARMSGHGVREDAFAGMDLVTVSTPPPTPAPFALELYEPPRERWLCVCRHGEDSHAPEGHPMEDRPCSSCGCVDFFPMYRDGTGGVRAPPVPQHRSGRCGGRSERSGQAGRGLFDRL